MKKSFRIVFIFLITLASVALFFLFISTHNIPVLEPKGMIGVKERDLIVTAALLMMIIVVPVFILTWVFAWRYRSGNGKAKHTPDWEHNSIAECSWWGVPFIIIIVLAVITYTSSHELNPFKPIDTGERPLKIQAIALEWKWLFLYPEYGIATVNYLQFPEKRPLAFEITADAPMNSFWIPQLGGQIYAMPAMRSTLHLIANEKGKFRGASANLSGTGFAGMSFTAEAVAKKDFEDWVSFVRSSSEGLGFREYNRLVKPSEYHPVEYFVLTRQDLFEQIIMKYMSPQGMQEK